MMPTKPSTPPKPSWNAAMTLSTGIPDARPMNPAASVRARNGSQDDTDEDNQPDDGRAGLEQEEGVGREGGHGRCPSCVSRELEPGVSALGTAVRRQRGGPATTSPSAPAARRAFVSHRARGTPGSSTGASSAANWLRTGSAGGVVAGAPRRERRPWPRRATKTRTTATARRRAACRGSAA